MLPPIRHMSFLLLLILLTITGCDQSCGDKEPELRDEDRPGIEYLQFSTFHLCTLDQTQNVWCAGGNAAGQLGNGSTTEQASLVQASGIKEMVGVTVGLFDTSCAWNEAGDLYCWGNNDHLVLGTEDAANSTFPIRIQDLPPVQDVTLGAYHACALTKDDEVYCWGDNKEGQAGLGDRISSQATPTKIESLSNIKEVRAGANHTCATSNTGLLYCWGNNSDGQLGQGDDTIVKATQPQVVGLVPDDAVDLAVSFNHSCATFGERRRLYCWGNNDYGQLGVDDLEKRNAPTEVPEIAYVDQLATGGGQVCARVEDVVYCAGEVMRPVEVARQTGEGYLFRPSEALQSATKLWSGVLAICGPIEDHSVACRGIDHQSMIGAALQ